MSSGGVIIRLKIKQVSVMGRATQGVKLIQLEGDDEVVDVAHLVVEEDVKISDRRAGNGTGAQRGRSRADAERRRRWRRARLRRSRRRRAAGRDDRPEDDAEDPGSRTEEDPRREPGAPPRAKVSDSSVRRLSDYHRILEDLERARARGRLLGARWPSLAGTNPAQIRKDLSYFGTFGKRGQRLSRPRACVPDPRDPRASPGGGRSSWSARGTSGTRSSRTRSSPATDSTSSRSSTIDPDEDRQVWDGVPISP